MKRNYKYEGERTGSKTQNIQETIEFILNKDYGTTITHSELSRLLNYNIEIEEELKKYKNIIARIKSFIMQYGYVLKGINGVGYYILKPSQISKHCYRTYMKRSARLLDKSFFVLDRTEKKDLNADRTEEINNMMTLNRQLIENMQSTIQESAYYSRKEYYDSLEE